MAKRPCFSDRSPRVLKRDYDRFNVDAHLESLVAVSDSSLIDASIDGLVESRSTDSDQNDFIQRTLHLGSVLLEAGKRSARKRCSVHNASVWPLPLDLTIKVFSMLDTPSVCSAAATCSFFEKCAMDPLCYANIDLATLVPKVNDAVVLVSTMIQRAGNALRSIKLGQSYTIGVGLTRRHESSPLTSSSSCLSSLCANDGAIGSQLRRLHLHHIEMIDNISLSASLSVCPSLVDLEIKRSNVEVSHTVESVSRHCRLIERFIYESDTEKDEILETSAVEEFVLRCSKITTLAIKYCVVYGYDARKLLKGFHELKYLDFSHSACFIGAFLKNFGYKRGAVKNLEVLLLRDCIDLEKVYVEKFMKALIAGKFRLLRHVDISNHDGLSYFYDECADQFRRYTLSSVLLKRLKKKRPSLCFVAEFPDRSEVHLSDVSSPTMSSPWSSYNSDFG